MIRILIAVLMLSLLSCGGTATGPTYDLKGFDTENIGGGSQLVSYRDAAGNLLTKGQVTNGVRTGAWITYHEGTTKVKTITNYMNGKKNGIEIQMNDRGQLETLNEFKNDQLHGMSSKHSFGRANEELTYTDGVLGGPFAIYDKNGILQRTGTFKNGKQHGTLRYYNEQGEITLEYEYKDGEKISGGIVKPQEEAGG